MIYLKWLVYFGLSSIFTFILFLSFFVFLNIKITYWFSVLIQSLVIILSGKWYFNLKLEDVKKFLFKDLKSEDWKKIFKITFFMLVSVYLVKGIIYWYYIKNLKDVEEKNYIYEFEYLYSSLDFFVFWLGLSLLGPFSEELLYRKGLFEILLKKINYIFSVIISSLVFALVHTSGSSFINGFVCGLFLPFLYKETKGSLIAVFVTHSIYNLFNFIVGLIAYVY
ncbi:MAG TPA: type II CAAX endopeptidase family protein [Elusimicrobiales bacterium]|nr:type II CAAX endopeptidase family protein [Elusimicrobiales bacterium]HOL62578.1 type II CAAX endopeptidase family protein [Elusimicrobiales bacterium]HPO95586.1 type II CAAX endopeptidase family protein [Elusimicrobiales bacterium]